jgi:hypothetical protein
MRNTSRLPSRKTSEENTVVVEESRIVRMEGKIDQIVEAMGKINTHEERIITLFKNHENLSRDLIGIRDDLKSVRDKVLVGSTYGTIVSKITWMILGAVAAVGVKLMLEGKL